MKPSIITYKKGLENVDINYFVWSYDIGNDELLPNSMIVERSVLKCRNVWKTI